ncbi:ABC transporter C family protein [Heterostelium album PN500]|uniref:ABC transporter C family protein n=1 Tax=Heterostelium pallidum (strain ATCC 26659 / Pp 5 / PN500) TaxID=670386 RepID=D3B5K6_HETP5|nr:ABC transporter C family protein [Heterostelium album PN500]EFA83154.1 ABC transporter C family protein [Heterostelium album PN500]|eukprot:XP_020435271.1 ABC transporter C family protein [Heterostelium album PN500]
MSSSTTPFCGDEGFSVWHNGDFNICFEDTVLMLIPALFILVFGGVQLWKLALKPNLTNYQQMYGEFRTWKRSLQLEIIVSLLLVAWKLLFMVVEISIVRAPYKWVYTIITLLQWAFSAYLVFTELKKGVSRSWKIRVFWIVAFLVATIKMRTLTLVTGVLFYENNFSYSRLTPLQGEKNANLFSRITFWWINPVLRKGYKDPLDMKDVPSLTEIDWAHNLSEKFEAAWEYQLTQPKPSLIKALSKAFGPHFYVAAFFKIVQDSLLFVGPLLLKQVLTFVKSDSDTRDTYNGMLFVLFYFLTPVIQSLTLHQYFHRCYRVGMWLRSAVVTAVYKKALRISLREGTTVGEIVNLMSVDAQRFMDLCPYLHMIWSAFFQIAVAIFLLYREINVGIFAGLAVLILIIPLNLAVSNMAKKRTGMAMKLKDKRIKAVNEVLNGIKVIKLYSWEQSFMDHVNEIRNNELGIMTVIKYIQGFSLLLWSMSPIFVSVTSFGVFIALNGKLTASIAFPALSLFNVMQFPINMLPMVVSNIIEASVSVTRLQNFLLKKDLDPNVVKHDIREPDVAIKIENATMEWETGRETLKNINLTVKKGELVAVVGHVGSGKSSLVSSLVGDLDNPQGYIGINGSIALVAQQAWIQNATLKNNIIFTSELDEDKYQRVIDSCNLIPDIKILPGGDQTEIGEKGINLSGGQKQRVSIARAVYHNADIYLFDDPLSAVDAHVGKAIFQNVIGKGGFLADKTRLLVTHGVHYLPFVDRIVMMKDGRIAEEGTYEYLMSIDGQFSNLMKHHDNAKKEDEQSEESEANEEEAENVDEIIEEVIEEKEHSDLEDIPISEDQGSSADNENDRQRLITSTSSTSSTNIRSSSGKKIRKSSNSIRASNSKVATSAKEVEPKNNTTQDKDKLIAAETRQEGKISMKVYLSYFRAIGWVLSGFILVIYVIVQALSILANWWLSQWTNSDSDDGRYYLYIYIGLSMGAVVATFFRSYSMVFASIKGSKMFHEKMFNAVIRSPMSFFDTTPLGRIINRFAKDQMVIDESISRTLAVSPFVILAMIPIAALFYYIQRYYLNSSRELTRLESISRSPIYSHFGETLSGVSTIRAFGETTRFVEENERLLDENQKCYYINTSANRWLALRLEFLGACIVTCTVLYAVLASIGHHIEAGTAGLVITYALAITSNMNWMVRMSCDMENSVVSVERIQEYTMLPSEAALHNDKRISSNWPDQGAIVFRNLWLAYREGLDPVLRGINCRIEPKNKIGIVGRTGAGKSSLTQALFRLVEPLDGTIEIDGINIRELGLNDLRSRIAIIPQDPVLFAGTVRSNLDPFNKYTDLQIWESLERAHLKTAIQELTGGIDSPVQENGENFSVGQRQLLCMGRALLKRAKIIVLDEATAAIDIETDALIQKTIRTEFADCTVLTIAHRINTIIDSDKVMVLDKGELIEFDSPDVLRNRTTMPYPTSTAGLLILQGQYEHYNISKRFLERFPGYFQPYQPYLYDVSATYVSRTGISAGAFTYGLFEDMGELGPQKFQPVFIEMQSADQDYLLRFFDTCQSYTDLENSNYINADQKNEYISTTFPTIANDIATKLGLQDIWEPTSSLVSTIFSACSYDLSILGVTDHWCSLFNEQDILQWEYAEDLSNYWQKSYGHKQNYIISSVLFQDMINGFDTYINDTETYNATNVLRFGHAETIIPFISLLGLYKDPYPLLANLTQEQINNRTWRSSVISPYAANVALLLYQCNDNTFKIRVDHNEVGVQIPGCDNIYCDYNQFKSVFTEALSFNWTTYCNVQSNNINSDKSQVESLKIFLGVFVPISLLVGLIVGIVITKFYLSTPGNSYFPYNKVSNRQ